jgi:hypothetical protein
MKRREFVTLLGGAADRLVVEVFYPRGSYRKLIFNIDVR